MNPNILVLTLNLSELYTPIKIQILSILIKILRRNYGHFISLTITLFCVSLVSNIICVETLSTYIFWMKYQTFQQRIWLIAQDSDHVISNYN